MKTHPMVMVVATLMVSNNVVASDVVIKLGGGLKAADEVKELRFQTGGRIQFDYNSASIDDGIDEVTDESDLHVRRARLFVAGDVEDWGFKAQYNIKEEELDEADARSDDGGTVEDLYIRYNGWGKSAKLTIGKQKESLGLEELTSSKDITFLERSAVTEAYAQGRNVGVQLSGDFKTGLHYDVGVFEDGNDKKEASRIATNARLVYTPLNSSGKLVHLGLAYSDRAYDISYAGFEAALVLGSFHAQYEYMEKDDDSETADGQYLQLAYILSGETRPYKGGKFKRVKPESKTGAWEVVLRYSDGEANYSDIELGKTDATEYGIGVNWYINNNVRLGATYSAGETVENNAQGNKTEGEELRVRTQFTF